MKNLLNPSRLVLDSIGRSFARHRKRRQARTWPVSKLGIESLENRALLSVSVVQSSTDRTEIPDAVSELTRDDSGLTATVTTNQLEAGVYTVWLVAFNSPELCHGPCNSDDMGREGVNASVMYLTGEVVDEDGVGTFAGYRGVSDAQGIRSGPGLLDPHNAEVHLAIRYHGPVIPERLDEQLTTFEGGCDVNTCSGAQFVVHTAPDTEVSIAPVERTSDRSEVIGATSRLTRDVNGVTATVTTSQLEPGAYTLWMVAFNNPELCHGECNSDDIAREGVDASVMRLTGQVVEEDGVGIFTGHRDAGDPEGTLRGPGLLNPHKAEIRLAIRSHGPVITERLEEQLTEFNGGCDVNTCFDPQIIVHTAPNTEVTMAPVERTSDRSEVVGATSRLTRDDNGVTATVTTSELDPGAYTFWMVAFNNPELCHGECNADDIAREGVDASVMRLTGQVVEEDGVGTFTGHRDAGDPEGTLRGPGLLNPHKAEVRLAIRSHGPVIPERLEEQLTEFNGGCDVNTCFDPQIVVHTAPNTEVSIAPVQLSSDRSEVEGATSRLTRDDNGVTGTITTSDLQSGVYTVWLVAFNSPELCHGPCDSDDMGREGVDASVMYLTGEVVEEDGVGAFAGFRGVSDAQGIRSGPGLLDPHNAEVHLAIRYHGPVIPERLDEQLTTFEGGCDVNTCSGAQFVVHTAPNTGVSIAPLQRSSDRSEVEGGTSRLTRDDNGVTGTITTSELDPGVYTVWLVAFNNPQLCHGPCNSDDTSRDGVDASVMYLTGQVVEEDGLGTFMGQRVVGDLEGIRTGSGLADPHNAEVHLAIRYHGPVIPERLDEQLTTFEGGCDVNTCSGAQFVVHTPSPQFRVGDVNGDFQFDQQDIAQVLQAGKYRTGEPASFAEGDWNGDGVFDNLDIIAALKAGNYLQGTYAAHSAEALPLSDVRAADLAFAQLDVE